MTLENFNDIAQTIGVVLILGALIAIIVQQRHGAAAAKAAAADEVQSNIPHDVDASALTDKTGQVDEPRPLTQSLRGPAPGDAVEHSPSAWPGARAVTLENVNHIAQTIGVVALLVSLVFVGIQVQQNSEQIEANTRSIKA